MDNQSRDNAGGESSGALYQGGGKTGVGLPALDGRVDSRHGTGGNSVNIVSMLQRQRTELEMIGSGAGVRLARG